MSKYHSRIKSIKSKPILDNPNQDLSGKHGALYDPAEEILSPSLFESSKTVTPVPCQVSSAVQEKREDKNPPKKRIVSKDTSVIDIELKVEIGRAHV